MAAQPVGTENGSPPDSLAGLYDARFQRRALFLLFMVYTCSYLDRQILNILAEQVKRELHLHDWQVGLMTGLAFALLYSILGLPIARYAERADRPRLIGAAIAIWSLATACSGLALNFTQMIVARIVVGIGEAGATPPAHSLISDYTAKAKRASALAFYSMGIPFGTLAGLALGGVISDYFGWRVAFFVVGIPGLLLAVLAALFLREPRRAARATTEKPLASVPLGQALLQLMRVPTFRNIAMGAALVTVTGYGLGPFLASFFLRTQGAELAQIAAWSGLKPLGFLGLALGVSGGLAGMIGTWFGGQLADKWARTDVRAYLLVPAIATLLSLPCFLMTFLSTSVIAGLAWKALASILFSTWYGPIYAAAHSVVPNNMRATSSAVVLMLTNLIGLSFGPLIVGFMSDVFNHQWGLGEGEGLRLAMIVLLVFAGLGAGLFWRASRTIAADMRTQSLNAAEDG